MQKKCAPQPDYLVAEHVLDDGGDAGVGDQVPDGPVFDVGMFDRVTAAALGHDPAYEGVDEGARAGDLLGREHPHAIDVALPVVLGDLRGREDLGILNGAGMEVEVPVHVG